MTETPPGRPSEPRTGPAAPAPAHGDGPTGPSTPTGRTALRDRIAQALIATALRQAREKGIKLSTFTTATISANAEALTDAVMPVVEAETAGLDVANDNLRALLAEQRQRAEQAERERGQARDAIADERRGRLAAEAAVRRVRELHAPEDDPRRVRDCKGCRTHVSFVPYEDCKTLAALDAEQPKETPQ